MAPEMVSNQGYDFAVDAWALGVLAFESVKGSNPIGDGDTGEEEVFKRIGTFEVGSFGKTMKEHITPACCSCVDAILQPDPSKRLGRNGARDIIAHEWFNGFDWDSLKTGTMKAPQEDAVQELFEQSPDTKLFDKLKTFEAVATVEAGGAEEGEDGFNGDYIGGFDGF